MALINTMLSIAEKQAIMSGQKLAIIRQAPSFKIGDVARIGGQRYAISNIFQRPLGVIALMYHSDEGYGSPYMFIDAWKSSHHGHYNPRIGLYIHWLKKV